jgi:hypothetical protein
MSQETIISRLKSTVPVLTALNVRENVAFWVERLGFTKGIDTEGFASVRRDEIELFICAVDNQLIPDNTQAWVRVSGLELLHAEWAQRISINYGDASGPTMTPIEEQPWGRDFAVRDTAGNCVHFNEPPAR